MKHWILQTMPKSQQSNVLFLRTYNRFSKFTRILAIINLGFPTPLSKTINLTITTADKIVTVLKVCSFLLIFATASVLIQKTQVSMSMTPITTIVVSSVNLFGSCILFTNLFIEFRYRLRIWAFITGICDFDYVVRTHCFNYYWIRHYKRQRIM